MCCLVFCLIFFTYLVICDELHGDIPTGYKNRQGIFDSMNELKERSQGLSNIFNAVERYHPTSKYTLYGNEIRAFHITANIRKNEGKPNILIVAGTHAREIVTAEIALRLISDMIEGFKNDDPVFVNLLEKYNVFVIPILNPDGYSFCFEAFRYWRKNRNADNLRRSLSLVGVDLNRNYGSKSWDLTDNNHSCIAGEPRRGLLDAGSNVYRGATPFSEIETKTIEMMNRKLRFVKVLDFHSFGREVSFGTICSMEGMNFDLLKEIKLFLTPLAKITKYELLVPYNRYPVAGDLGQFAYEEATSIYVLFETCKAFQPKFTKALEEVDLIARGVKYIWNVPIPIEGRVINQNGVGISDVRIEITNRERYPVRKTDHNGFFHFFVPPENKPYRILVNKKYYDDYTFETHFNGTELVWKEITLPNQVSRVSEYVIIAALIVAVLFVLCCVFVCLIRVFGPNFCPIQEKIEYRVEVIGDDEYNDDEEEITEDGIFDIERVSDTTDSIPDDSSFDQSSFPSSIDTSFDSTTTTTGDSDNDDDEFDLEKEEFLDSSEEETEEKNPFDDSGTEDIGFLEDEQEQEESEPTTALLSVVEGLSEKKQNLINNVLFELLETEEAYYDNLLRADSYYFEPMKMMARKNKTSLSPHSPLFDHGQKLQTVIKITTSFLEDLHQVIDKNNRESNLERLGEISTAITSFSKTFRLYTSYISSYHSDFDTEFRILTRRSRRFKRFCGQTKKILQSEGHRFCDLDSLMITPIQRIPRISLLLKQLVQLVEHEGFKEAHRVIEESASFCNQKVKEIKNVKKIRYLETSLEIFGFVQPYRKIVREGWDGEVESVIHMEKEKNKISSLKNDKKKKWKLVLMTGVFCVVQFFEEKEEGGGKTMKFIKKTSVVMTEVTNIVKRKKSLEIEYSFSESMLIGKKKKKKKSIDDDFEEEKEQTTKTNSVIVIFFCEEQSVEIWSDIVEKELIFS